MWTYKHLDTIGAGNRKCDSKHGHTHTMHMSVRVYVLSSSLTLMTRGLGPPRSTALGADAVDVVTGLVVLTLSTAAVAVLAKRMSSAFWSGKRSLNIKDMFISL